MNGKNHESGIEINEVGRALSYSRSLKTRDPGAETIIKKLTQLDRARITETRKAVTAGRIALMA